MRACGENGPLAIGFGAVQQGAGGITVRAASELTGAACGTIRAAVRRGAIAKVGELPGGPDARDRWLFDYETVLAWHGRSGLPAPVPADPIRLALDESLASPSIAPSRWRPSGASRPSAPA
jgi:hypothetical protein